MAELQHITVLLKEAVDLLAPRAGGVYLDGTIGGGGHTEEILKRSGPDGFVIGLDQDAEAVQFSRQRLSAYGNRILLQQANYRDAPEIIAHAGYDRVDGVLLDLGVSWFHVKSPERGFSFMLEGPLDMRMDTRITKTAADLVNTLSREELAAIIRTYGEEPRAASIARAIEKARSKQRITRTVQLAEIISSVFPTFPHRRIHPATLTFQALRIAVNDEISALREGLDRIIPLLKTGGRVAVISFHSLEDRVVKQTFSSATQKCVCPPRLPVCVCNKKPSLKVLTKKPLRPAPDEIELNPAARSAKLRAAEKI